LTAETELARAVRRLVDRVSHWSASRWRAPVSTNGQTRADLVHGLVQEVADIAAAAEGQPRRKVPRLDNDAVLPDQLRVVAADLVAAAPTDAVLQAATDRVVEAGRALGR
jgi:hypothetical protein